MALNLFFFRVFQINYILWKKFKLDIIGAKLRLTLTCQILVIYQKTQKCIKWKKGCQGASLSLTYSAS